MNGMQHVGSKNIDQLKQYFNAYELALYKPKKDQCNICTGYEVGNIQYNAYQIQEETMQPQLYYNYIMSLALNVLQHW